MSKRSDAQSTSVGGARDVDTVIDELDRLLTGQLPCDEEPVEMKGEVDDDEEIRVEDEIDHLLGGRPSAVRTDNVIDLAGEETGDDEATEESEVPESRDDEDLSGEVEQKPEVKEEPQPECIEIDDDVGGENRTIMVNGVEVSYEAHRPSKRTFKAPPVKITKPPLTTYAIKEEFPIRPSEEDGDNELRGFDSTPLDAQILPVQSRVNVERECLQIEFEDEQTDLIGGAMCLFYTQSPFADSAPHPFLVDGRYYYTLEHFFQVQMLLA